MDLAHLLAPVHRRPGEGRQLMVITDSVTVKAETADTGGAYALYEVETPPAGGCPPHTQRYDDETFFVIEGQYNIVIGAQRMELGPGGYAFIPRGTVHAFLNPGPAPARMLALVTPGGIHGQFLDDVGDHPGRAPWEPDMARLLAAAPKYGVAFLDPDLPGDPGFDVE